MVTTQDVINGRIQEPFGVVRLCGRAHEIYYGPVYRLKHGLWILYNNRPLEVIHCPCADWNYVELY